MATYNSDFNVQSNTALWTPTKDGHLVITDSLLCPLGKKALTLNFLYIQPILYGHPVNTHTFYGPSVSVLTEFDCSLSSRFVQNHSAEV